MTLDVAWAERWTRLSAERIAAARDELTELDRQIGDGDHGENLDRGFRAVVAKLDGAAAGSSRPVRSATCSSSWPRRSCRPSAAPRARSTAPRTCAPRR